MNNIVKLIILGLVVFGAYSAFNSKGISKTSDENVTSSWVRYSFISERFSAMFPSKPKVKNISNQGVTVEFAETKTNDGRFSVGVVRGIEISEEAFYPFSLIKKGAKLDSSYSIEVSGYHGKEFSLSFGKQVVTQRFINYEGALVTQTSIVHPGNEVVVRGFNGALELYKFIPQGNY